MTESGDVLVEAFQPVDGVAELETLNQDTDALPVMLDPANVLVLLVFVHPAVGHGDDVVEQEMNSSV